MPKQSRPLLDSVMGNLPKPSGRGKWIETLSADDAEELRRIYADWSAGLIQHDGKIVSKTALAVGISRAFAEKGRPVHEHTVARWLERL